MIRRFPIAAKILYLADMMNVQNRVTARTVAADLASMSIATNGLAPLAMPIGAIVNQGGSAPCPVRIVGAADVNRTLSSPAHIRAKASVAFLNEYLVDGVGFAAIVAWLCDVALRAASARLGLNGRELVGTMLAAKTTLAIGVMVKLCFAPFTNEDGMLGGVAIDPAVRKPTSLGTETAPGVVLDKWSAALFTGLGSLLGFASALIASSVTIFLPLVFCLIFNATAHACLLHRSLQTEHPVGRLRSVVEAARWPTG